MMLATLDAGGDITINDVCCSERFERAGVLERHSSDDG